MTRIREAIIVEGRYDREKLSGIVDSIIVETKGFRIFKDAQQRAYIQKLAKERGIIILTDSDSAGFLIRNHLKSFVPEEQIKNAYLPRIVGKERRKRAPSKEGLLGVEGQACTAILKALTDAGAGTVEAAQQILTTADLYMLGLTGKPESRQKRLSLLDSLQLPPYLSTKDLLKYLNRNFDAVQPVLQALADNE